MKRPIAVLLVCLAVCPVSGQSNARADTAFSITAFPNLLVPLATTPRYFTLGGGAGVAVDLPLPFLPLLGLRAGLGYTLMPIWTGDSANLLAAVGGLSVSGPTLAGRITTELQAGAGYYYGIIADETGGSGGNALFSGGLRLGFRLGAALDQGLEVRYEAALDGLGGLLYHGLSLGLSTRFSVLRRRRMEMEDIVIQNLYPVLYKRYTDRAFGSVTLRNPSAKPVEDLRVTFYVEKYMDSPWECPAPPRLEGGQSAEVSLLALFSETNVLGITEATVVSGMITATYTQDKQEFSVERTAPIRILDRHAITWDDDRKPAAYVTYKDPLIVDLATSVARVAGERAGVADTAFRTALALHESLRAYGLDYRVDPTTPFVQLSQTTDVVDYLQFPRNTLQRKAGDCDDLSILYAAVLQAVGVDTAFITIPGHIYMAVALKGDPEAMLKLFSDPADLVLHGGRAWVPIEITMVDSPFLEAWKAGATEWVRAEASGEAVIYPLSEAWTEYEPVGQVGEYDAAQFVSPQRMSQVFTAELDRFVGREIFVQAGELEKQAAGGQASARTLNRLGAIYARYGQMDKARAAFEASLGADRYLPALINLGNTTFLAGDLKGALSWYEEALGRDPDDATVLLQLARVHNRLGSFQLSLEYYQRLKAVDAGLAGRHVYLDVGAAAAERAASREASGEEMMWVDE